MNKSQARLWVELIVFLVFLILVYWGWNVGVGDF
jgi:hypothetical protein